MSISKYFSVIEIAGLPGSGKSTVCKTLSSEQKITRKLYSPVLFGWINKLKLDRLFLPVTCCFFNSILRKLFAGSVKENPNYHFWLLSSFLKAVVIQKRPRTIYSDAHVDIILIFNRIILMYLLAATESMIRRVNIIMDDGFFQRGLSLWLRCGRPAAQEEVTGAYYELLPSGIRCVVLCCEPEEALRRVVELRGRLNSSLQFILDSNGDANYLQHQYRKMLNILIGKARKRKLPIAEIDNCFSKKEQAGVVKTDLSSLLKNKDTLFWIC